MTACSPSRYRPSVRPSGLERQGEVGGELAGEVEDAAAAAVDPVDLDAQGPQSRRRRARYGPGSRSAHADRRRVLAEDRALPPPRSPRS